MIKLQNMTPEVYYKKSRDFQFIGRLYDVVLNSVKTNSDLLYNLPLSDSSDSKLVDLMAMTLGFKSKHNYNVKQLVALCAAFEEIIKNKGTIYAIDLAGKTLANAEGLSDEFYCYVDESNPTHLVICFPSGISDTNLMRDLLNYILPAGMTYQFIGNCVYENALTTKSLTTTSVNILEADENTVSIVARAGNQVYYQTDTMPSDWKVYYTKSGSTYTIVSTWPVSGWASNTYYTENSDGTYTLTTSEPKDWGNEWYNKYYTRSGAGKSDDPYIYTKLTTMIKWSSNTYYYCSSMYVSSTKLPIDWKVYYTKSGSTYNVLTTWPAQWAADTYYVKTRPDTSTEPYTDVYTVTTSQPADWGVEWYKNYYTRSGSSSYTYTQLNQMCEWAADTYYYIDANAKDTAGLFVNSTVIRPTTNEE